MVGSEGRIWASKRITSQAYNEGATQAVASHLQAVPLNNDVNTTVKMTFERCREEDELTEGLKDNKIVDDGSEKSLVTLLKQL